MKTSDLLNSYTKHLLSVVEIARVEMFCGHFEQILILNVLLLAFPLWLWVNCGRGTCHSYR